nr:hypothetical protein [Tanacetum cinerariifolium]
MTLSPPSFRKRYRSSYETPSSSASLTSSLTLPSRKRYQGTSEPIVDTKTEGDESKAEGIDSESREAASEDQQQQAVLVEDTAADEPLGLRYKEARRRALKLAEGIVPSTYEDYEDGTIYMDIESDMPPVRAPVQTPASPEWLSGSLPISPASPVVPLLVATLASVKTVEEGFLAELGAQLELHGGILYDHTQHLDTLPHTLFEGYDRDFTELFSRS